MNFDRWHWLRRLKRLADALAVVPSRDPGEYARLIVSVQRSVIVPARALAVGVVLYFLFNGRWMSKTASATYEVVFETVQTLLVGCALFMFIVGVLFYLVREIPRGGVQWMVFAVGLADGLFLAGLTVLTGGFSSDFYWVYPVLIMVNAAAIPLATPQIVLNLLLVVFFLAAGHIQASTNSEMSLGSLRLRGSRTARLTVLDLESPQDVARWLSEAPPPLNQLLSNAFAAPVRALLDTNSDFPPTDPKPEVVLAAELNRLFHPTARPVPVHEDNPDPIESVADPYILRVAVLLLLTVCCYEVPVLLARERRIAEEREEFLVRTAQLHAAGRLAAEIAHQIKNPLAIINNVTFSLHKNLKKQHPEMATQVDIIREEIGKADRIITQIMGYAQLSEGRVQKIEIRQELQRAIAAVFPPGLPTKIKVHQKIDDYFPPVMMHQPHLSEAVGNLLQNARDVLGAQGNIFLSARCLPDYSVEICVRDDGPGIPEDQLEKVFEAYYTTKPRGTGLGLAVVKHNVELYGGTVRVESALGRGAKFTLQFPARTLMKPGP